MVGFARMFRRAVGTSPGFASSWLQAGAARMSSANEAAIKFDGKAEDPLIFAVRNSAPLAF